MSLSICLLTRNAEHQLERVLRSVAPLGAEVIVADTGSVDATVPVARDLGARAMVVPWNDDFGAAQNEALAHAKGDWVLWLNPDEEVLPGAREQLPGLLGREDALAYVVRVQQLIREDQLEPPVETVLPRLFRRHPEIRFLGRLHPHFDPPLDVLARRENKRLYPADLVIRHHAYTSTVTPDKLRWATRLLELELRDRPGQLHYLIEYGRNLLRLNDPRGHVVLAEAAEQVLAAQHADRPLVSTVGELLEYLLTVSAEQSRSRLSPEQARELALRWFPNSPPLLWTLAQRSFHGQSFRDAAGLLERLVHLGSTGTYDRSAGFDPSIMGEPALLNLGTCYIRLGDLNRAEACFGQLLASPTHQVEARQKYALVQELRRGAKPH